jgi:hypothetical protein
MNNRIIIFSADPKDQDDISWTIEAYLRNNFKKYTSNIETQKFSSLSESTTRGYAIGKSGEILVVFDRRLCPREERRVELKKGEEREGLIQLALEMSKKECDKNEIPYVQYEGEIRNGTEDAFITKINRVKEKIKKRLELKF